MPRATSVRCGLEETLNNSLLTLFNNILGLSAAIATTYILLSLTNLSLAPCAAGREWELVNKICGVCRKGISASTRREACVFSAI